MLDFVWFFARIGWRWPIADQDMLEIWRGVSRVADLPGGLVKATLTQVVTGAVIQQAVLERTALEALRGPIALSRTSPPSRPPKVPHERSWAFRGDV